MSIACAGLTDGHVLTVIHARATFLDLAAGKTRRHPRPGADVMVDASDIGKHSRNELNPARPVADDRDSLALEDH